MPHPKYQFTNDRDDIDYSQFEPPELTPEEIAEIKAERDNAFGGDKTVYANTALLEPDEDDDENDRLFIQMHNAKVRGEYFEAFMLARKVKYLPRALEFMKQTRGMEWVRKHRNVEYAVREYGLQWLDS